MARKFAGVMGIFGAAFLIMAVPCAAQVVNATLTGTVTDPSGASVPKASVTATEKSTGIARSTVTNTAGDYNIPYLDPGTYRLDIVAPGFKKYTRDNLTLEVSTIGRADAALSPGEMTETVTITAEAALLQTDSAEVARNFETRSVSELPLINRDFQQLAGLAAGVSLPAQTGSSLEDAQGTYYFNSNGQGNSSNNTIVDGIENTNFSLGVSLYLPNAEDVSEVRVSTNNYSAEFGRAGGAVVNAVTRGGTNSIHGSLWEFNRVADLTARDFFNKVTSPKPGLTLNLFGAAIGGPIVKDKTFFYGTFQGKYVRQASTSTNTVPQTAWLTGNFSGVPGLALYDPSTGNPATGAGRQPFPNNIIPPSELSPVALKLNMYWPQPNLSGLINNFVTNVPFRHDDNSYDVRVDHSFTSKTQGYVKFNTTDYNVFQGSATGNLVGTSYQANNYTITATTNLTHVFSPTLVTEVRLGYNRWLDNVQSVNTVTNQQLGITDPTPDQTSTKSLASIQINSLPALGAGTGYPILEVDNIFTGSNTWTKIMGKHTLKWGGEVTRRREDRAQPEGLDYGPRGKFVFNPGTTELLGGPALGSYGALGNSFAAFDLGDPNQSGRTYMVLTPTNRQTYLAPFIEDTYRITRRLTLSLGLRYDLYTTVTPRYKGGAGNYDAGTNTMLVAGYGSVGLGTRIQLQPFDFAPRLGFAYTLDAKTVIRGGFGISYWEGRFGFTGGTLDTQYPAIYYVSLGVLNTFPVGGSLSQVLPVTLTPIPSSGMINPAPDQPFYQMPAYNPTPYTESYNLTVQRQVTSHVTVDAAYVGNVGRHLPYTEALNVAAPGTGSAGLSEFMAFGRMSSTTLRANGQNSSYNSLQGNLNQRFSHGLTLTVAYAFSKSLDVESNQGSVTIPYLPISRQHGLSSFDQTNLLTISHTYELPFGKGRAFLSNGGVAARVVSDWQLNGVFRLQSGLPYSPTVDATSCNCPGNSNFANVTGPIVYLNGIGPGQPWVSASSFAVPPANTFGNAGRDILRGPGLKNYDFSLFRTFPIREWAKLQFRAEFYNLTNTPHFANPNATVGSASFGLITGSAYGGNRAVQLGARVIF